MPNGVVDDFGMAAFVTYLIPQSYMAFTTSAHVLGVRDCHSDSGVNQIHQAKIRGKCNAKGNIVQHNMNDLKGLRG